MWRIEPSGDGEPLWLTPHPRDLNQPEGEREILITLEMHIGPNKACPQRK